MALDTQLPPEPSQSEPTSPAKRCDLRLADGIELLGQYRGSGLNEPPYLIQRADGHNVQVSRLVYLVAEAIAETGDAERAGVLVSQRFGREVSADNVRYLVDQKLTPVGIIPADDPEKTPLPSANPLLALRLRVPLVPERAHRAVTTALRPMFWPPMVVGVLVSLVLTDLWLLTSQRDGIAEGMRTVLFQPHLLLVLTLLTLLAGAFHELGHAAAARYGGARPGAMGAGVYLVWPVFYTDVSDTYRLDRRGRLRTDLGGVYFNVVFILAAVCAFVVSGYAPLLVLVTFLHFETLRQFLPFVRLDGYYVVSDLAGVPNLFAYMGPVLQVLLRRRNRALRRQAQLKLQELTRRARALIVGWVVVTAPVLLGNLLLFLFVLPRLAGMAWGSASVQLREMSGADGSVSPIDLVNGTVSLVLLALPVAGISYLLVMILRRGIRLAARWRHRRPALTGALSLLAGCALVLQVAMVWPDTFSGALRQTRRPSGEIGPSGEVALADLPLRVPFYSRPTPAAVPIPQRPVPHVVAGPPTDGSTPPLSGAPTPETTTPPAEAAVPTTAPSPPPGGTGGPEPRDPSPAPEGTTTQPSTSAPTTTTTATDPRTTTPSEDGLLPPATVTPPLDDPTPADEWRDAMDGVASSLRQLFNR